MRTNSIQNILVPVDFSELSVHAVDRARILGERFGATVHLAHCHQSICVTGFNAPMAPAVFLPPVGCEQESQRRLMKQLRQLATRCGLHSVTYHVCTGAPIYDELCRLGKEIPADLIVMPTHGHTGFKRLFLGSTAERVVQHAPCPVFVVRTSDGKNGRVGTVKTILVPVDFSACSFAGLEYAIDFAKKFGARIIVHHAVDFGPAYLPDNYGVYDLSRYREIARQNAKEQMREFVGMAKFDGVDFETAITVGPPVWEICSLAETRKIDLVITSTHGRTGFKHVLIGSTAECIVRQAPCAVLVVPSHPEVRTANLSRKPAIPVKSPISRKVPPSLVETEKVNRKYRKRAAHAFPERRAINKFRESHALR